MLTGFAACIGRGFTDHDAVTRRLLAASTSGTPVQTSGECFAGGAIGVSVRLDRPAHPFPPLIRSSSGSLLAVAGVPTLRQPGDVAGQMRAAVDADSDAAISILTSFDGAFFAVLYDARSATTILVGDFFGAMPIYVARRPHGMALATRQRALVHAGLVPLRPDPAGWGAFVGAKHFIGDDTSIAGVVQHPAATVTRIDMGSGTSSATTYWRWPETDDRLTLDAVDTGAVVHSIAESVSRYQALGAAAVLPLSGGFESRLLAGILAESGDRPLALSLPNPYEHHEIEARFARDVANALGLEFERAAPPADFFATAAYEDYLRESEVGNTSINLPIALLDAELVQREAPASWDGVMYGLGMKDFSRPDRQTLTTMYLAAESTGWQAARQVFAAPFVDEMREALAASSPAKVSAIRQRRKAARRSSAPIAPGGGRWRTRSRSSGATHCR